MNSINNIAGISVATSASNNNINNYKFFISGGHEFADFAEGLNFIRENNWTLNVRGLEGIRIGLNKPPYGWELYLVNLDPTDCGKALQRRIYDMGQRLTSKKLEQIAEYVYNFISEVEDYEHEQSDWADFLDMCDRKADIVSAYQTEIDGYVQDIIAIEDKMENIYSKMEAFAIKQIVKKIAQTEKDCYDAIMDAECDCFGTEIDLAALWNWYNNYGQHYTDNNFSREDLDLEDLIDALDYIITESDKPLGCDNPFEDDDWEEVLEECYDGDVEHFFQIFEEEFGYSLYDYPMYLWDSLTEFARTYVHYAYCA